MMNPEEVVPPDEQGVRIEDLGARRSVVSVVEPHQGIAQEGRQQSTGREEFLRPPHGSFDGCAKIAFPLRFDVTFHPESKRQRIALRAGEGVRGIWISATRP